MPPSPSKNGTGGILHSRLSVSLCVPNTKIFGKGSGCCCLHNNFHRVQHPNSYRSPQCHISHQNCDLAFDPSRSSKVKSDCANRKSITAFKKSSLGSNFVFHTVFKIFRIKGLLPWPLTSQGHLKWSLWALYIISVGSNITTLAVLDIFDVKCMTLIFDPQGHPRSNLTVPIESPWLLSKKSSLESNLVSSPFSRYFESKDCDLDLQHLKVIQSEAHDHSI